MSRKAESLRTKKITNQKCKIRSVKDSKIKDKNQPKVAKEIIAENITINDRYHLNIKTNIAELNQYPSTASLSYLCNILPSQVEHHIIHIWMPWILPRRIWTHPDMRIGHEICVRFLNLHVIDLVHLQVAWLVPLVDKRPKIASQSLA